MSINSKAFKVAASKSGYNIALDHLIPALAALRRGNTKIAAKWFSRAVRSPDFKRLLAGLEYRNQQTYARTKLIYRKVLSKLTKANDPEILDIQYDLYGVPDRLNLVEKGPGIFDQGEYDGEEECIAPDDRTNEWMVADDDDDRDVSEILYKDDQGDMTESGVSAGLPDEGDTRKPLYENEELLCEFEEEEMVDSPTEREEEDLNEAASMKSRVQSNLKAIAEVSVSQLPTLSKANKKEVKEYLKKVFANLQKASLFKGMKIDELYSSGELIALWSPPGSLDKENDIMAILDLSFIEKEGNYTLDVDLSTYLLGYSDESHFEIHAGTNKKSVSTQYVANEILNNKNIAKVCTKFIEKLKIIRDSIDKAI